MYKITYFEVMPDDLEITNPLRGGIYPKDALDLIEKIGDGWRLPTHNEMNYLGREMFFLRLCNFKRGNYLIAFKDGESIGYDFHRGGYTHFSNNTPCRIRLVRSV
jgi:hypothetical protein